MAHRIPYDRLQETSRRRQKLRARAEYLEHASSSSIVVGLYGVALAYAMTRELLPWLIAVAPFPLAAGLAIRARRFRKRLDAHERRMGRLVQGSDPPPPAAGVHRLRRLRPATRRRAHAPSLTAVLTTVTIVAALVGVPTLLFAIAKRASAVPYVGVAMVLLTVGAISMTLANRTPRRASGDTGPERVEEGVKPDSPSPSVAAERAASQDLLEIDRFVRRLYAALARSGVGSETVRAMLAEGARFDLVGGWWQRGSRPGDENPGLDGAGTEQPVGFRERSRTVHVIADVAVVISTCVVESGSDRSTAVNALQLRRSRSGWLLCELLSRNRVLPVTERTADPRPPSAIRRAPVAGGMSAGS